MTKVSYFIYFLIGTFSFPSFCQNLDSLRSLTKIKKPTDTTYILTVAELSYQLYSTRPDSSLMLARQSDSLAKKIKFIKGEGRAQRVIGIYYWSKGDFSRAMSYFERALSLAEKSKDQKGIASCLSNIGVVYRNQGNIRLAADYFFRSLKIRETINDKQGMATTSNNLGLLYTGQHIYDKAQEYFRYSIKITKEIHDLPGTARAYLNIGQVFQTLNQYKEAIDSYQQSLQVAEEIGDKRGISLALDNLAEVYLLTKQYDKALPVLNHGLKVAMEFGSKDRIADIKEEFANYYNTIGNSLMAYRFAGEAASLSKEVGVLEIWKESVEQKYLAAKKLGRFSEALDNYSLYIKLRDSMRNEEITKTTLSKEYDFKSQKLRVEQERKEFEHLATEERQKRFTNTFAGVAFTFVIISLLIFISNRKIKKQKKELSDRNEELNLVKEEIASQRDVLSIQNNELQSARKLIELQNAEISQRNETLEEEVGKRTIELAEYNRQLEQFAFMSAHNLRAPVARILGLGNLLAISPDKPEEKKLIIDKIVSTTYELDEVVREINIILQAQKDLTAIVVPLNIPREFQRIKNILYREINKINPIIIEDYSKISEINSVKTYFQSIFLNLFSNAIKYRDPNRKLIVTISSEVVRDYVVIKFSDTGLGIDLSRFGDKLFNLYSRFHFHVQGKGIGLYLVKTQLASIGGKIEVESKEGIGTTFRIYLKLD